MIGEAIRLNYLETGNYLKMDIHKRMDWRECEEESAEITDGIMISVFSEPIKAVRERMKNHGELSEREALSLLSEISRRK